MPRKKKLAAAEGLPAEHVEVASTKAMPTGREKKLLQEIADLQAALSQEKTERSEIEKRALADAEAQGQLMQRDIQERPTGKVVSVQRLKHYKTVSYKDDGRPILKPVFKTVEIPTFFYKVDLPPCGGTDYKINGIPFYHGAVYELDIDTLRTVKEIVFRCWRHDADIHGSDENFYRKPRRDTISARSVH